MTVSKLKKFIAVEQNGVLHLSPDRIKRCHQLATCIVEARSQHDPDILRIIYGYFMI